ncbi:hypothetical protein BN946_scf184976.g30 [Trametes cinnabarina]|uniref:Transmembrane protein n=1 Tax=Pycnoporus cinnabarinus TaxID=5643 RepID=A0A060S587_PYCCI|nr:hypothetical protein BN946_scf184976.g30 [Trametes cinnabarina]
MTDEPVSLPHTPASHTPTARLFNGGLLSLPQQPRNNPPMFVPLVTTNGDNNRKWTQEDQDETDEKECRKAMRELVQSWMDRLQLISVITTFFAAMEAQLLGSTIPDDPMKDPPADQVANAALTGALVVHVFAAILSFLAAFFLIRYKLTVAKREERKVESGLANAASPAGSRVSTEPNLPPIFSSKPHLEQVGPFRRGQPPTHLLDHCHSLCMWLAAVGFVLALVGVLAFAWARLALSSGVFASICVAVCLVSGVGAVFWPASTMHG